MKRIILVAGFVSTILVPVHGYGQQAGNVGMTGTYETGGALPYSVSGQYEAMLALEIEKLGYAGTFLEKQDELELSDAQVSQLMRIQQDHDKQISQLQERVQILEGELENIISDQHLALPELNGKIREVQTARTRLLVEKIDYAQESRAVLSGEQRGLAVGLSGERQTQPASPPGVPYRPNSGGVIPERNTQ